MVSTNAIYSSAFVDCQGKPTSGKLTISYVTVRPPNHKEKFPINGNSKQLLTKGKAGSWPTPKKRKGK